MTYVFTWDARKAALNLERHKISFEEARTVFFDPFLLTLPDDEHSDQENREISIGYLRA